MEIRKTRPKIDVPFKCYIYCTKGGAPLVYGSPVPNYIEENLVTTSGYSRKEAERIFDVYNGKVIGEFICNDIINIFADEHCAFFHKTCLTDNEFNKYLNGLPCIKGWRISDLLIYDKPKELSEFLKYNRTDCHFSDLGYAKPDSCQECMECALKRPP